MNTSVGSTLSNLPGPILITGHTGFKGTWLSRYLQALGVEIAGYSLPLTSDTLYARAGLEKSINEHFGDICNFSEFEEFTKKIQPSAIIHLAAQSLVMASYQEPIKTFSTNVMGTANVLEVARRIDSIQAVAVITTDKVYENRNSGRRFIESDPISGTDPYSASKAAAENVVNAWATLIGEAQNKPVSVFRAGNVIGGGDYAADRLMPDIVRAWQSNRNLEVRNPQSTRPWQHVLDPLRGYVMALEATLENRTSLKLNFGPRESALTVESVLQTVKQHWPNLEISSSQSTNKVYESILLDLDSSAAESLLNWVPQYSQKDSILSTLKWWERHSAGISAVECIDFDINRYISDCSQTTHLS